MKMYIQFENKFLILGTWISQQQQQKRLNGIANKLWLLYKKTNEGSRDERLDWMCRAVGWLEEKGADFLDT